MGELQPENAALIQASLAKAVQATGLQAENAVKVRIVAVAVIAAGKAPKAEVPATAAAVPAQNAGLSKNPSAENDKNLRRDLHLPVISTSCRTIRFPSALQATGFFF